VLLLLGIALLFCFPTNASLAVQAAQATSAQQEPAAKPASPEQPPAESPQRPAAAPTTPPVPANPTAKPKKVITNDDLKGGGNGGGFSAADFSLINNCNRACFEQVRQQAHLVPSAIPNWKRDLLQAVEQIRNDNDWQKYLRDLYEQHVKFCNLGFEKRQDLAKYSDPNNVTPRELAIDEKYDAKFREAQNALRALDARQASLQRKYAGYPLAYQFTMIQASRIQTANCYAQGGSDYSPNDADDP
jgi:hypothetical protein